jgi:SPP1 family phage portal protein
MVKAVVDNNPIKEANLKIETWRGEYDGTKHAVADIAKRPDKLIGTGTTTKLIPVARNVVTLQKKIVRMAVSFLLGNPPTLSLESDPATTGNAFWELKNAWKKSKLRYFNKRLMRDVCIETHAAELWYTKTNPDYKPGSDVSQLTLGVILLSERTGNKIYPYFDEYGDMVAFARDYETKETGDDGQEKKVRNVHIYTAVKTIFLRKAGDGAWEVQKTPNPIGKIPVIYYRQEKPEWADVQNLIDQLEKTVSDHSDTNAYFASPAVKSKGKLLNAPDKGEIGKFFQLAPEKSVDGKTEWGDIEYMTWDQTPESLQLEIDNLKEFIYSMTSTPDISFNNVKGLGTVSGIALKLMFLDALLKSDEKAEIYGECFDRRNNLLIAMLSALNTKLAKEFSELDVSVEFHDPLPGDISELIETLTTATGGEPIMSQESAVAKNPLVTDVTDEMEKIRDEASALKELTGDSYGMPE